MSKVQYDSKKLDELCSQVDLYEYLSQSYEFKKIGNNYYCNCPFHNEKTGSFMVDRESQRFYCFGCGAHGNILNIFTKLEGLTFPDALKKLMGMLGLEGDIKMYQDCSSLSYFKSLEQIYSKKDKDFIREPIDSDQFHFVNELPQEWIDEGIHEDIMQLYEVQMDKVKHRIITPMYDNKDNLIGYKGRTTFKDYKEMNIPKYWNYTKIHAQDFFEGMKWSRENIEKTSSIIIFEGIKSCMKARGYGYYNTVAAGTSILNEAQVDILLRMGIKDVTVAFDQDVCMDKIRATTSVLRRFTNVYVVFDRHHVLQEKDAPVDEGEEVWDKLFRERERVR